MDQDVHFIARALRGDVQTEAALRIVAIARANFARGLLPDGQAILLADGDRRFPADTHPERYAVLDLDGYGRVDDTSATEAFDALVDGRSNVVDLRPVPNRPDGQTVDHELSSWQPVDLSAALAGTKLRPEPTILRRTDGRALFYEGKVNYLHGADGTGKSFVGLFAAAQVMAEGGHVAWVDYEDPDELTIVGRLRDHLGVPADQVAQQFHYVHPDTEAVDLAVAVLCDMLRHFSCRLVVLDSIGEAMGVDGVNEDKDVEVTPWLRRVLRPMAATGAAVLPIDHGVKTGDNPLHPSGSKRKRAQVTGAAYLVESPRPLSREFHGGQLMLTTAKDRHGNHTRGKLAALIDVAIYPDDGWTLRIEPPPEAERRGSANDLALARAVVRFVKGYKAESGGQPPSLTAIEQTKSIKAGASARRAATELAVNLGALREEAGARRARMFHYLKDLDDG
jgi:hypothetical protein